MRFSALLTGLLYWALTVALPAPVRAEAVIAGTVQAREDCAGAPMEAWLSSGSTLLYQIEIPQKGSFEFHVNSGTYNLVVIGATGCLAETEVEARENDTRLVTLAPSQALIPPPPPPPPPKNPDKNPASHSALDWLISAASAATDCPQCTQSAAGAPFSSNLPGQAPWWQAFGATSFTGFGYPGPWLNGGIDGKQYPPEGAVFADKPVLYVNGPDGTPVSIRPRLSGSTHWLVAAPRPEGGVWRGVIQGNRLSAGGALYRYIYYDYRGDQEKFQDSRGFCAGRGELISKLSQALKASGFKPNEVEDFAGYWRFKIPPSERYCVYPQANAELTSSVTLEIEPKPSLFTQLFFIVQLGENLDGKGKFRRAPVATWLPTSPELPREPAASTPATSTPATSIAAPGGVAGHAIQVREWGIGFLEGHP